METKQVIVIRKDLKMRKGKMCAQAAHASMKVILNELLSYRKGGSINYQINLIIDSHFRGNDKIKKVLT